MENRKLSLRKTIITKLNNLHQIKGGSIQDNLTTIECTSISTKTNTDLIHTEDNCNNIDGSFLC